MFAPVSQVPDNIGGPLAVGVGRSNADIFPSQHIDYSSAPRPLRVTFAKENRAPTRWDLITKNRTR
jgi:hypothetical protein